MKGSREHKRYIAILRSVRGKKNGIIPSWAMDDLRLFHLQTDRKWRKAARRARDGNHNQPPDL